MIMSQINEVIFFSTRAILSEIRVVSIKFSFHFFSLKTEVDSLIEGSKNAFFLCKKLEVTQTGISRTQFIRSFFLHSRFIRLTHTQCVSNKIGPIKSNIFPLNKAALKIFQINVSDSWKSVS